MAAAAKSVNEVARDLCFAKPTFYRVINGESKNQDIRWAISSLIDEPINKIWPEPEGEENA